jgi:hypothetical protein
MRIREVFFERYFKVLLGLGRVKAVLSQQPLDTFGEWPFTRRCQF